MAKVLSDIEIAQQTKLEPIVDIAKKVGLTEDDLELYGKYKAKISFDAIKRLSKNKDGKLVLVTAITPTPAGEGKTLTTIGLAQALNQLGHKTMTCLREPSLGPVFGIKGGAAGGGYSQVLPMEDINLHLLVICMPLQRPITFWQRPSTITSIKAMLSALTSVVLCGNVSWT